MFIWKPDCLGLICSTKQTPSNYATTNSWPHLNISLTNKVLVDIVGSGSDDGDFTEQGERDAVNSTNKAVNLLVAAGLLLPKLVAGEGQHVEVIRPKVPLELLQVFVVLFCEATFTGYIHHQGHLRAKEHTVKKQQRSQNCRQQFAYLVKRR